MALYEMFHFRSVSFVAFHQLGHGLRSKDLYKSWIYVKESEWLVNTVWTITKSPLKTYRHIWVIYKGVFREGETEKARMCLVGNVNFKMCFCKEQLYKFSFGSLVWDIKMVLLRFSWTAFLLRMKNILRIVHFFIIPN